MSVSRPHSAASLAAAAAPLIVERAAAQLIGERAATPRAHR